MRAIGAIVRLQVQQASLKVGEKPRRRYDPAAIRDVPALLLAAAGVTGLPDDGAPIVDVHHREHPRSKNVADTNAVSVGFTAHYQAMRGRFGTHLSDGIAGENILVETHETISEADLAGGLVVETQDGGRLHLTRLVVAEPCVEFSRFALRHPHDEPSDRGVAEALAFLRAGTRGFYAVYAGDPAVIRVGDRVLLS